MEAQAVPVEVRVEVRVVLVERPLVRVERPLVRVAPEVLSPVAVAAFFPAPSFRFPLRLRPGARSLSAAQWRLKCSAD